MDWDVGLRALSDYKKKHGNTKVPEKTMLDNGQGGQFDLGKLIFNDCQITSNTGTNVSKQARSGLLAVCFALLRFTRPWCCCLFVSLVVVDALTRVVDRRFYFFTFFVVVFFFFSAKYTR